MPVERSCGSCGMCCKLPVVAELNKPRNKWCVHAAIGTGCKIYETRPSPCRAFNCEWLLNPHLGDAWKPDRAKFFMSRNANEVHVFVDLATPNAWRAPEYYPTLKRVAFELLQANQLLIVVIGDRRIVVLPDRDEDVGNIGNDHIIQIAKRSVQGRTEYLVRTTPAQ